MNAHAQSLRVDRALTNAFARRVFAGDTFAGRVHKVEDGFLAESRDGRLLGRFAREQNAVRAVLAGGRR